MPGGFILIDKKSAFWVTSTLLVCTFVIFVILAFLVTPTLDISGIDPNIIPLLENLNQLVWWMTVGLVMLPIVLLLLALAIYFLFTTEDEAMPRTTATPVSNNAIESKEANEFADADCSEAPSNGDKVTDAKNSSEALDLRYARGEISRDKYMEMQRDLKKAKL